MHQPSAPLYRLVVNRWCDRWCDLSPLKSQLFKYNLTDNPFCPSCIDSVETPMHYFIECNTHHANRQIMIKNLLKLNPNLSSPSDFLDYILKGSICGTNEQCVRTNKAIFCHVSIFMFKSQRFILNFQSFICYMNITFSLTYRLYIIFYLFRQNLVVSFNHAGQ